MTMYGVVAITGKRKYNKFLSNLNIYHGKYFPLLKQDQVYKVVTSDFCVIRVGEGWSTGDLLGFLTVEIEKNDKDRFYCFSMCDDKPIRFNDQYCCDCNKAFDFQQDKSVEENDPNQNRNLFYLANYLHMLEKDQRERGRIPSIADAYTISDRFQHWTTDEKYQLRVDAPSRPGRSRLVEVNVIFQRFDFYEVDEWIRPSATALGFNLQFYRNGKFVDDINDKNFIETEIVFTGKKNWKEKLNFKIDGEIVARTISVTKNSGEWEKIVRRPYDVALPTGILADQYYERMMIQERNLAT